MPGGRRPFGAEELVAIGRTAKSTLSRSAGARRAAPAESPGKRDRATRRADPDPAPFNRVDRRALHYIKGRVDGNDLQLQGKTVLITGASSGIGRACALRCARDGAKLILAGRRREALEEAAREAGGATVMTADLGTPEGPPGLCDQVLGTGRAIDVLVHSAGVGMYAPSFDSEPEPARALLALNFLAPVEINRRLLPLVPAGGSVVLVSSIAGKISLPGMAVYSASKHALNAYANVLRTEMRGRGIHVLSACPGYVSTPFTKNMLRGAAPAALPGRERFGISAEQCAEAILMGVIRRKRTVVVPRAGWLLVAAERLLPATAHALAARHLASRGDG